jgi:hypothetical protein
VRHENIYLVRPVTPPAFGALQAAAEAEAETTGPFTRRRRRQLARCAVLSPSSLSAAALTQCCWTLVRCWGGRIEGETPPTPWMEFVSFTVCPLQTRFLESELLTAHQIECAGGLSLSLALSLSLSLSLSYATLLPRMYVCMCGGHLARGLTVWVAASVAPAGG